MEAQTLLQGKYVVYLLECRLGTSAEAKVNMKELKERLQEFMECEVRSCSMDFGCITPEYVYRSWGGQVPLNEIEEALRFQDSRVMIQYNI